MKKHNRIYDSLTHAGKIREQSFGHLGPLIIVENDITPKEFGNEYAYPFSTNSNNLNIINGISLFSTMNFLRYDCNDFELISELLARGFLPEEIQYWLELNESEYYNILEGY